MSRVGRQVFIDKMDKQVFRKEITELLNNIKEHLDNAIAHDHIPELELDAIIHKVERLHQKTIVLHYITKHKIGDVVVEAIKKTAAPDLFSAMPAAEQPKKVEAKQSSSVVDVRTAIGINEKFQFINDLFDGNMHEYTAVINQLNNCTSFADAEIYLNSITDIYKWKEDNEMYQKFIAIIKQKLK